MIVVIIELIVIISLFINKCPAGAVAPHPVEIPGCDNSFIKMITGIQIIFLLPIFLVAFLFSYINNLIGLGEVISLEILSYIEIILSFLTSSPRSLYPESH